MFFQSLFALSHLSINALHQPLIRDVQIKHDFPSAAQAVVIGGGVIGTSTAYHLAALGWTDVVVLERDKLTSGRMHVNVAAFAMANKLARIAWAVLTTGERYRPAAIAST